jgi:ankyrin repeat protein
MLQICNDCPSNPLLAFVSIMTDPLMTWDTFSFASSLISGVEEVDLLLDRQRRFQAMLADEDIFYNRTDLRMLIDRSRDEARAKLLALYAENHDIEPEILSDLVLHAAAWLKVSPLNTIQVIKDYPDLVRQRDGPQGSLPLHIAATATGDGHFDRLEPFLDLFPEAAQCFDKDGLLPLHSALISGADQEVAKLLLDLYPDASKCICLPRAPVSEGLVPFVGMLPFHISCCRSTSDVIYTLLLHYPECLVGALSNY